MTTRKITIATTLSIALIALTIMSPFTSVSRSPLSPQPITQASPASLSLPATLHARGATFPAPLVSAYASNYHSENPNVTVSYQAVGSGAGQRALINKTDDFDASDAPLSANQRILAPNVLHIPETIGSVTLSYNLTAAGIPTGLNLTGAVIADIYLGAILNWNDAAIQGLNPGVTLPNHSITTVHRSDSSGTTFVFTSFLSLDSPTWATTIGSGTAVNWPGSPTGSPPPIAVTGNGNGGVASVIASTPYSLGYVELNYALAHKFTFGNIQNPAGNFIVPTLTTTQNAIINFAGTFPQGSGDWSTVSLLNQPGAQTYPIASFSYFLVYKELNVVPSMDLNETFQAKALTNFLYWAVNNPGQSLAPGLFYVPLPTNIRLIDNASIASITFTTIGSPTSKTIALSVSNTGGWSNTAITVYSGDTITLSLSSSDGLTHQWFLDLNNNGVVDANETSSPPFSSTTSFAFTPKIGVNIPTGGNWVYKDANNIANTGTLTVIQQQVAAPFHPASTLSSSTTPKLDTSKVSTIGTAIIDSRALTVSGNITVVAVDATSGLITAIKSYIIPGLQMFKPSGAPNPQVKFLLNAAVSNGAVSQPLSSDITIQFLGATGTATTQLTRQLDLLGKGTVNIFDAAVAGAAYGCNSTQTCYNPAADFNADGIINIFDFAIFGNFYGALVFR